MESVLAKVIGFGGIFLRAGDPAALSAWYETHLGLKFGHGFFEMPQGNPDAPITFTFCKRDSDYFPPAQPAMLNFQVDDLDALLDSLIAAGVPVDPKRESFDYGRFGWFSDPEGNRVELWQPFS